MVPVFNYIKQIQDACYLLDDNANRKQIVSDTLAIFDKLRDKNYVIAVFAPFNYGKSTLLNALLGQKVLPIDLVPTTGTTIKVKYGSELVTRIRMSNGKEIVEKGTEILETFAVLSENRTMRKDVVAVEVSCPHPLLKNNVELIDLPGTNDMKEQNAVVREQLLKADLIIQVLNAQQLFTLNEKETLRQWLIEKGIKTVLFVVNFINILETQDQQLLWNRACSIANNFHSDIPENISNLYRVDALPALRAKIKKDQYGLQASGIRDFEQSLQRIICLQQQRLLETRLPRVKLVILQVKSELQQKQQTLVSELRHIEDVLNKEKKRKEEIRQRCYDGFSESIASFYTWLSGTSMNRYISSAASALKSGSFRNWETGPFKRDIQERTRLIQKWVDLMCETFQQTNNISLNISFPPDPDVNLPSYPDELTGFGKFLDNLFNDGEIQQEIYDVYCHNREVAYRNAADDYLASFQEKTAKTLSEYKPKILNLFVDLWTSSTEIPLDVKGKIAHLEKVNTSLNNLNQALNNLN